MLEVEEERETEAEKTECGHGYVLCNDRPSFLQLDQQFSVRVFLCHVVKGITASYLCVILYDSLVAVLVGGQLIFLRLVTVFVCVR